MKDIILGNPKAFKRSYYCIGGSRHGRLIQMGEKRPGEHVYFECEHETYVLTVYGLQGTRRRLEYLVLGRLADEEAVRLIDAFEAEEEPASHGCQRG